MQEEVTQRTVALCVEATKLSAGMLQQAMKKVLDEMQKGVTGHKTRLHHGKQTLRQLMKHNTGVSNIEITDQNIRAFSATAKKYGIDFALKKDTSGEIPRYLVFFKGRDADVITAAFREFSAINLEKEKKPSIRKELEQAKQQAKAQHRQRVRNPNGQLGAIEYTILEEPRPPEPGKPERENPVLDNPEQASPVLEEPEQENPAQLNTNRSSKEKSK